MPQTVFPPQNQQSIHCNYSLIYQEHIIKDSVVPRDKQRG